MLGSLRSFLLLGVVWICSSSAATRSPVGTKRTTGLTALTRHPSLLHGIMMNSHLEHRSAKSSPRAVGGSKDTDEDNDLDDDNDDDNEAWEDNHHDEHGPLLVRGGAVASSILQRLKVGFYFGLWYALNVFYNSK